MVDYVVLPSKSDKLEGLTDRRYSSFNFLTKSYARGRQGSSQIPIGQKQDSEKIKQILLANDQIGDIEDSLNLMKGNKFGMAGKNPGIETSRSKVNQLQTTLDEIEEDAFDSDLDESDYSQQNYGFS